MVPDLPWKFDFADGQVPVTWIGARYRHIVRDVDGEPRDGQGDDDSQGHAQPGHDGPTDLHDYTIQADVLRRGEPTARLPDIGLIAQRYTMDLMGDHQEMQIRSWTSQLDRFSKTVPFKWEADTWYTMKFRAATEDGKAVLKGKVWNAARGARGVDDRSGRRSAQPGRQPGLFGNAQMSEILIDNVIGHRRT